MRTYSEATASHTLLQSVEDVEARMLQLVTLLPDMLLRLERIKADIVLQLVQDPQARSRNQ